MQRGEVKTKRISSLGYEAVCAFMSATALALQIEPLRGVLYVSMLQTLAKRPARPMPATIESQAIHFRNPTTGTAIQEE